MRSVQIPLWTIVTEIAQYGIAALAGSDSSMDDCNIHSGLPAMIVDRRSDSSMDDCNERALAGTELSGMFRFLYGRL